MKNSYNPFKMWGSWVGAIIGFLTIMNCHTIPKFIIPLQWECTVPYFPDILKMIFYGFLIGWGIHSLFRRLK